MRSNHPKTTALALRPWCAALLASSIATATYGQVRGGVQQVQQGNALDANPQVGAGGSNTPVQGYIPLNANNYIYGNVAGLKSFNQPQQSVVNVNGANVPIQNSVTGGLSSPYTLNSASGNASFNNWIRESAGGLQTTPTSAAQAFYLPSATVSTAQGSIYSSPYGSGFDSGLVPSAVINPAGQQAIDQRYSGILSSGIPIRQFSATPANAEPQTPAGGNISSPLFGQSLATSPLSVNLSALAGAQGGTSGQGQTALSPNLQPANPTPGNEPDALTREREQLRTPSDRSSVSRINNSADVSEKSEVRGESEAMIHANVLPKGKMLANELQVSETYKTLLGELEKAKATEAARKKTGAKTGARQTPPSEQNPTPNIPGTLQPNQPEQTTPPANGTSGRNFGTGTGPRGTGLGANLTQAPQIDPVTGKPIPAQTGFGGVPYQSTDPTKPGYRPRAGIVARSTLESTPTSTLRAGQDIPELKSFAREPRSGVVPPDFDRLMKTAEGLLQKGKYIEAANEYQVALSQQPDNALAILGRANAELAAGMYESAAADLKFLFARKPEMVSVKYALGSFIPPQRQHELIRDLHDLSRNPGPGNTAEFLLCYLDYNTGRSQELQDDLGTWGNRTWKDSWQNVLQRAWGKE